MQKYILTDTCFWIGLIDDTDQHHTESSTLSELISDSNIILPYPCLYETVNTKLTRNKKRLALFEKLINKENVTLISDSKYRKMALDKVFERNNKYDDYSHSLVDAVLREMIKDVDIQIDYLISFNEKDFIDVCVKRNIQILRD
ncbi:hypothetical protein [Salegentibacter mishustinae]|uniref:hypothetical protein n=1 Tax=Salegentibacter mishustinae TaxID=270918 RepID=UPI00248F6135|nr:hypothetical protein [Salegentibacter mishustinae]